GVARDVDVVVRAVERERVAVHAGDPLRGIVREVDERAVVAVRPGVGGRQAALLVEVPDSDEGVLGGADRNGRQNGETREGALHGRPWSRGGEPSPQGEDRSRHGSGSGRASTVVARCDDAATTVAAPVASREIGAAATA